MKQDVDLKQNLDSKQNLALFDLDNTLLAGDSDYNWGLFLINEGLLDGKTHQARNDQFYQDYKNGNLDIYQFLEFQLKPLSEHPKTFLDALHLKYMEKVIRPMMTQKAQELVDAHKAAGDLCVVITATNSFVTKPIATAYGIEHLIGTDPEMIDGQYTGGVQGVPSFQEGKVTRINDWLKARGQQLGDFSKSYFYSDSHNDLPLMKLVTNPVAVDADPTLTAYAISHEWPQISLRT
ncbi:HAD family hydrolase [Methylotenera mobilis]|jgi:HAD superfamily hydrolase (TIGR01490 family)|uniref:HAD-IB family hydrolase n=1 Tax=Methylotenera mobilis TaxID=359408 RepID=A0A351RBC5_9PROT|nr:HAD family hydrolase [Methylotenera mobilis]PPC97149.1 MAG: HAD-IB family hydrolase [Methylotenera sp.]PPD47732.1 MAG: HAD-IB family hydrolase [Methylotenera sp.]HBA09346.1 HAD-IB family hydrolase [Methylotenera mobilis]